jgi:hypothetical protein
VPLDGDDAMPVDTDSHLVSLFFLVNDFSGDDFHCTIEDRLHLALFGHNNLAVFGIIKGRSLVEKVTEGLFPQGVLVATFLALFGSRQKGSIHKGITVITIAAKVASGADDNSIISGEESPPVWSFDLCLSTKKVLGHVNVVVVDASFRGDESFGSVLGGLDGGLVEVKLGLPVDFVGRENQGLLKHGNLFWRGLGVFVSVQVDLAVVVLVKSSGLLGEVGQDGLGGNGGWGHDGREESGEGDDGVVHDDDDEVEGGRGEFCERLVALMGFEIVRVSGSSGGMQKCTKEAAATDSTYSLPPIAFSRPIVPFRNATANVFELVNRSLTAVALARTSDSPYSTSTMQL